METSYFGNAMLAGTSFVREDIPMGLSYEALVKAFEREMGKWDPVVDATLVLANAPWETVEAAFAEMAGKHGLMIFFRADQDRLTSLTNGIKRCSLYIAGNGVIAEKILTIDVRASLYVPFRVCLYDNGYPGGAILGYEPLATVLAVFHQQALNDIGQLLDSRIFTLGATLSE
ncbi:DUF302 domain-containing protein [Cohnella lupini]|uniref:Uncharacterized protein DUF302 n=1 Tax=Cohnella lupini TaxID=1294267 RepID=A0A3D9I9T6_9BACL|nr:DUF302 domain-containing protein [Cohnella lupini]RED58538.1 uncharacterized protein DUF302 [Cohnella lupini]